MHSKIFTLIHDKEASHVKTYYEEDKELFTRLNQDGWGVFFAVNEFEATEEEMQMKNKKTKRNGAFLKKLRYVYADLDIAKSGEGMSNEEKRQKKDILLDALYVKCEPTMVIETANGIYPLWRIEEDSTKAETQVRYINTINGVIEWSKKHGAAGDAVKDTTRVLRAPGYYHMKEEPFMVKVISKNSKTFTIDELSEIFPYSVAPKQNVRQKTTAPPAEKSVLSNEIDSIDFQELVVTAFKYVGRQAEFDKEDRLVLDGRLTGTFQGKLGDRNYLASTSHEPFEGNHITVVADILSCTNKEAFKWIVDTFNINLTEIMSQEEKEEVEEMGKVEYKPYTWGTPKLDDTFWPIKQSNYVLLWGEEGSGKTTYAFDMAMKNARLGHKVLFIVLESTTEEIYDIRCVGYAGYTQREDRLEQYPEHKLKRYDEKMEELKGIDNLEMFGFPPGEQATIERIREVIIEKKPTLVFIDNLGKVAATKLVDNKFEHISQGVLDICTGTGVPVVLIHHARKRQGSTKQLLRNTDDIRESGKIKDDASYIVQVARNQPDTSESSFVDWSDDADPLSELEAAKTFVWMQKNRRAGEKHLLLIYYRNASFQDEF